MRGHKRTVSTIKNRTRIPLSEKYQKKLRLFQFIANEFNPIQPRQLPSIPISPRYYFSNTLHSEPKVPKPAIFLRKPVQKSRKNKTPPPFQLRKLDATDASLFKGKLEEMMKFTISSNAANKGEDNRNSNARNYKGSIINSCNNTPSKKGTISIVKKCVTPIFTREFTPDTIRRRRSQLMSVSGQRNSSSNMRAYKTPVKVGIALMRVQID